MYTPFKGICMALAWACVFGQPLLQNAANVDIELVAEESRASAGYARDVRSASVEDYFDDFHEHDRSRHGHHHHHHHRHLGEFHGSNFGSPHPQGFDHLHSSKCGHPAGFHHSHSLGFDQPQRPSYESVAKAQSDRRYPSNPAFSQRHVTTRGGPSSTEFSSAAQSLSFSPFASRSSSSPELSPLPPLPSSSNAPSSSNTVSSSTAFVPSSSTTPAAAPGRTTDATDLAVNIDLRFGN